MGRKKGQHSAGVRQRFIKGLGSSKHQPVSLDNSTRHDSRKAFFQASCKNELHLACRTVDSMNDGRKKAGRCRVCCRTLRRQPSSHEKRAYKMLDGMEVAYATEVFMFDTCIDDDSFGFKLSKHPFDILLVDYMLLIEIDGNQHFQEKHHGKCSAEQQYKDAIINAAVLDEGWSLVRLHYMDDEESWKATIAAALQQEMASNGAFVHFSPSYMAEPLP